MLIPLTTLIFIPIIVVASPVRTILCCCGCMEEPCPLVGPNCQPPTVPCDGSEVAQCSTLQRLYDISQLDVVKQDDVNEPFIDEENSNELLPTLDARELLEIEHDIVDISTNKSSGIRRMLEPLSKVNRSQKMNSLQKMSRIVNEIEGMLLLMKEEMSNHATEVTNIEGVEKENIKTDVKTSKRNIQKAANEEFGGHFNVICSPCEFSFVVASQKYCDGFKEEIACFAFLQPPSKLKLDD